MDDSLESLCSCDPLKVLLQWFFQETLLQDKGLAEKKVLNMMCHFYKSSVLRCKTQNNGVTVKILLETIKAVQEWQDSLNLGTQSPTMADDKFGSNNLLERVSAKVLGLPRTRMDRLHLGQVVPGKHGSVDLQLDTGEMTKAVIEWTVSEARQNPTKNACHHNRYFVEVGMPHKSANNEETPLVEYRKNLVGQAVSTAVKIAGHSVDEEGFIGLPDNTTKQNMVFIVGKPVSEKDQLETNEQARSKISDPDTVVLLINVGQVSSTQPTSRVSLSELINIRLDGIKQISESRRLQSILASSWVTSAYNLAVATVHFDLLSKPLEADVCLPPLETNRITHDALFIMYNYSRLLSILRKFNEQVIAQEYPPLPDIRTVDFSLICSRQEELQLLRLVMEWPRIRDSVVNFVRFELNLNLVCKFLFALAKAFNSFWPEIIVLVPTNAVHNFPAMMARIYFMKAICAVFEDCLDILRINHT